LREAGYDVTSVEYDGPHTYQPAVVAQAMEFVFGLEGEGP
jgi:hypothetical protein